MKRNNKYQHGNMDLRNERIMKFLEKVKSNIFFFFFFKYVLIASIPNALAFEVT